MIRSIINKNNIRNILSHLLVISSLSLSSSLSYIVIHADEDDRDIPTSSYRARPGFYISGKIGGHQMNNITINDFHFQLDEDIVSLTNDIWMDMDDFIQIETEAFIKEAINGTKEERKALEMRREKENKALGTWTRMKKMAADAATDRAKSMAPTMIMTRAQPILDATKQGMIDFGQNMISELADFHITHVGHADIDPGFMGALAVGYDFGPVIEMERVDIGFRTELELSARHANFDIFQTSQAFTDKAMSIQFDMESHIDNVIPNIKMEYHKALVGVSKEAEKIFNNPVLGSAVPDAYKDITRQQIRDARGYTKYLDTAGQNAKEKIDLSEINKIIEKQRVYHAITGSAMINGYMDFHLKGEWRRWKPYIGAGIGMTSFVIYTAPSEDAGMSMDLEFDSDNPAYQTVGRFAQQELAKYKDDPRFQKLISPKMPTITDVPTVFSFQAMAGVGYEITENLTFDTEIRYFGTTGFDIEYDAGFGRIHKLDMDPIHDIGIFFGLRYQF